MGVEREVASCEPPIDAHFEHPEGEGREAEACSMAFPSADMTGTSPAPLQNSNRDVGRDYLHEFGT